MITYEQFIAQAEDHALSKSLPISLRVAKTIGDQKWLSWIKLELMGYNSDNPEMKETTIVPEYRTVAGHWYNDFGNRFALDDPELGFVNTIRLRQGVAELEAFATSTNNLVIRPMAYGELIRNNMEVDVSNFEFHPGAVGQILINIKTRLNERIVELKDKINSNPVQEPKDTRTEKEIFQLKPSFMGMSVDLKALWFRYFGKAK